ncbi:septum formation inhibitor Maf [Cellvibrio sp. KY-GH-1]|uniref:Maf family protein n=1 Tax=Cellvibrio sp. KY-GH-1 TaxID=2303332 RepID=UPI0012A16362|nr:Maf family protein [Cellvibrio sp. KY-GH-1]QEY16281.1 septum formation inhibitor Maf [Cellvibrio sp. KY-GH-1]
MIPDLYLASQSPRRRELLDQIGVMHSVVRVSVPEQMATGESALAYVQRLAREKAAAGFAELQQQKLPLAPVLGADTLGLIDGVVLEKPRDKAHARQILRQLSGRTHEVITAIALHSQTQQAQRLAVTRVTFRELSDAEIDAYWETGEPQDKAGGYGIQGLGAVFVKEIHGSYSCVVGLPIEATCELLREFRVPWWSLGVKA